MSIISNKKFWILLKLLIVIFPGLIVFGCTLNNGKSGNMQQNQAEGKAKVYVCSMHPQVTQFSPGDCPICGMMLIEKLPDVDSHKQKTYVCSMHPQVIKNEPGDCPICGMLLVEKPDQNESQIPDELMNITRPVNESVMASVQTIVPSQTKLPLIIAASGIINFDSHRISTVSAKFGGLIERSYVKFAYQFIRKGQKIYDIYCPEIYYDHWNYINIMKKFPDQPNLNQEARHWLELQGLTDQQIEEIIKAEKLNYHLSVYSQVEGYAVSPDFNPELSDQEKSITDKEGISLENAGINLKEGQVIQAGTPLFKVLNTDRVRADLKIRTEDMGLLKIGQKMVITDAVSPERMYNAIVNQIEPLNGGLFQLVKVYITDNEKLLLPGRQIQAYIQAGDKYSVWIPKSSVVNLGQKKLVFLLKEKIFIAVNINTGLQSGDHIEVLSGIDTTSQIALNASLLTDSDGFIKSN